jgi:hypothetical protein
MCFFLNKFFSSLMYILNFLKNLVAGEKGKIVSKLEPHDHELKLTGPRISASPEGRSILEEGGTIAYPEAIWCLS